MLAVVDHSTYLVGRVLGHRQNLYLWSLFLPKFPQGLAIGSIEERHVLVRRLAAFRYKTTTAFFGEQNKTQISTPPRRQGSVFGADTRST